jgi:hypothetical protein
MSLLDKLDTFPLEVTEIGIDQAYATAMFEIPADASRDWLGLAHFGAPSEETGGGLIFPIEHGRWIVSIGNLHGGALPGEIEGFNCFVKAFRMPTSSTRSKAQNRSAKSRATTCPRASDGASTGSSVSPAP